MAENDETERDDSDETEGGESSSVASAADGDVAAGTESSIDDAGVGEGADEGDEEEHEAAGSVAALLGPERWVQFAFVSLAVVIFFLTDRLTTLVWEAFAEPDPAIVSAAAVAVAVLGTFALYRHPPVNQLATEVVGELSRVTWPTRDEVWVSTTVVIVTSVVASVYTGLFDALWSALTNMVYG